MLSPSAGSKSRFFAERTRCCRPSTQRLAASSRKNCERHGVRVLTGVSAAEINQVATERPSRLSVLDFAGARHEADLVLLAVGARPDSELAGQAGAKIGAGGAIVVTRQMRTNLADVFAAGDCVETYHRLLDAPTYISLGTIAHKQGRVAGENAVGGERSLRGRARNAKSQGVRPGDRAYRPQRTRRARCKV